MADKKSKIPSIDELGKYVGKLFTDIKSSVKEIFNDYQKKHPCEKDSTEEKAGEKAGSSSNNKPSKKAKVEKKTNKK